MQDDLTILGLILGGGTVGSIVTAAITAFFNRAKVKAEADGTIISATTEFVKIMQRDIIHLRERLDITQKKHEEAREELDRTQDLMQAAVNKSQKLEEIVAIMQKREAQSMQLINKLKEALIEIDPKNVLVHSLEAVESADVNGTPTSTK